MPEGPEVALTAQILNKKYKNKIINKISFVKGTYVRKPPNNFELLNFPLKIINIDSVGKLMFFELENGIYILSTFGLSGLWSDVEYTYTRIIIDFDDSKLFFVDKIGFGKLMIITNKIDFEKKVSKLKPDFLKDDFDLSKITKYKQPVVKLLMDQNRIGSGIGNYLVAEILYRAKLNPHRLGNSLEKSEIKKLTNSIKYTIKLAYMNNITGYMTNFKNIKIKKINYHPEIEINETFEFQVYRQKTDPLGNKVVGSKIVNSRTTYWVPNVQK